jgi:hypothetical protein
MADKPKTNHKPDDKNDKKPALKSCFIVTPIGEPNSEVNQKAFGLINAVMKPVLADFDYQPIAASDISSPGSINKQIIIRLYEDELVIANLTGLNPNVMYELAVRHAVKKPVIIMAEKGTKLPFDLVDQRCIFYEDNLNGVQLAKELLQKFLSTAITDTEVNNPIYDSITESQIIKKVSSSDDPNHYLLSRFDRLERFIVNQYNNEDLYRQFAVDGFSKQEVIKKGISVRLNNRNSDDLMSTIYQDLQERGVRNGLSFSVKDNETLSIDTSNLALSEVNVLYKVLTASKLDFS